MNQYRPYQQLNLILFISVIIQTLVQEVEISTNIFFETEGCCKRIAVVINSHIEWLGISSKLACLQITPLVANGSQGALLAIKRYLHRLRKRSLVIYIK